MFESIVTRIVVILTLLLGTAGLRSIHISTAHCHENHAISAECDHDHSISAECDHDHDLASCDHLEPSNEKDSHTDTNGQDEQSCETCVALLALAFETTDAPALFLTAQICETVSATSVVAPADCSLSANRARPPPIA